MSSFPIQTGSHRTLPSAAEQRISAPAARRRLVLTLCLALTVLLSACGTGATEANDATSGDATTSDASPTAELNLAQNGEPYGEDDAAATDQNTPEAAATPEPGVIESAQSAGATVAPPEEYATGPAAELEPAARNDMYATPPPMVIDPARYYYATLKTAQGDIRVQLFADRAPITVNNFVFLANEGYYNDTSFHRVIDGFMAQAGDPTGTGAGGPGYTFEDEFYPGLQFDQAGLLAMANSGPNTNGSQFFLTFAPTDWLDYRHTIFGKIIEGEDVLARLSLRDPNQLPDFDGDTLYTVLIEETDSSVLPTPTPLPPTPTPTPSPTPYAPTELNLDDRPLRAVSLPSRVNYFNQPPSQVIEAGVAYTATIVTSRGDLIVSLATETHPLAVNNFIVLARLGFYDNTPITLVRPDDSIIFGLPDNNPLNDAGYKFPAEMGVGDDPEFGSLAYIPFETRDDGTTLSSSSQILIALVQPVPQFKEQLSFFGKVVEGQSLLNSLTMADTIVGIRIADAAGDLDPDVTFSTPAGEDAPPADSPGASEEDDATQDGESAGD